MISLICVNNTKDIQYDNVWKEGNEGKLRNCTNLYFTLKHHRLLLSFLLSFRSCGTNGIVKMTAIRRAMTGAGKSWDRYKYQVLCSLENSMLCCEEKKVTIRTERAKERRPGTKEGMRHLRQPRHPRHSVSIFEKANLK